MFSCVNMCKWLMNDHKITRAFLHLKTLFKGMNKRERDIIYVQKSLIDSSYHKLLAFFYNI